jgi:hypothetical protein
MDPWWQGKGCGSGKFRDDGRVSLTWPTDPETGMAMDPFAQMVSGMLAVWFHSAVDRTPSTLDRSSRTHSFHGCVHHGGVS